jgi:hypothetical protein
MDELPRTPSLRSSRGSLIYLIAPVRRANSMGSHNTSENAQKAKFAEFLFHALG